MSNSYEPEVLKEASCSTCDKLEKGSDFYCVVCDGKDEGEADDE